MTSNQQCSFGQQSSGTQYIYSGSHPNKVISGKVSNIIRQYNCSNYFHVAPRRELMSIVTNLLEENNCNLNARRKISRLESELNVSQQQLESVQNKLSFVQNELTRAISICNNLTYELEDSITRLDNIHKMSNKKRNFSEID